MKDETKWVFIVGINNSGTTLLNHVMGLHPEIDRLQNEGQWLRQLDPNFLTKHMGDFKRIWSTNKEALDIIRNPAVDPEFIKKRWLKARVSNDGKWLVEKSPSGSVRIPWLNKHFQPCKFIGIIRNGYSVVESIIKRGRAMEDAAKHWITANRIMLKDSKNVQYFKLISYEELASFPTATMHSLTPFIGVSEFDYGFLSDYIPDEKYFLRLHKARIRNMNRKPHRKFRKREIDQIYSIAGNLLDEMNYSPPKELVR